ncbi:hypothetical protein HJC23_013549 [Cyclotella cryptica]|uniref:Uncharacterized protein n=1 Tax=Cyclotella cryptica TaxID=29204 RepID=A0ABD3P5Q2_9STRA
MVFLEKKKKKEEEKEKSFIQHRTPTLDEQPARTPPNAADGDNDKAASSP